jgi:TctA family transporter
MNNVEKREVREIFTKKITNLFPTKSDFKRMIAPVVRGTALGSLIGILPGGGVILASFGSYALEKKVSKYRSEFGKGAIEGVAGPEAANNAAAQTSFIPLLTLGIPPSGVMAMILGAMMIHNIQPGPLVMTKNPTLYWGLITSMWTGNLMLVVLNLPLIGIWVKMLAVPYRLLYPAILTFCCVGSYTVSNSTFDVMMTACFGLLGYISLKLGCEGAPLMLGFVLGPMMEENFRRALLLSRGKFTVFFTSPISLILLLIAAVLLIIVALPSVRSKRDLVFTE